MSKIQNSLKKTKINSGWYGIIIIFLWFIGILITLMGTRYKTTDPLYGVTIFFTLFIISISFILSLVSICEGRNFIKELKANPGWCGIIIIFLWFMGIVLTFTVVPHKLETDPLYILSRVSDYLILLIVLISFLLNLFSIGMGIKEKKFIWILVGIGGFISLVLLVFIFFIIMMADPMESII